MPSQWIFDTICFAIITPFLLQNSSNFFEDCTLSFFAGVAKKTSFALRILRLLRSLVFEDLLFPHFIQRHEGDVVQLYAERVGHAVLQVSQGR